MLLLECEKRFPEEGDFKCSATGRSRLDHAQALRGTLGVDDTVMQGNVEHGEAKFGEGCGYVAADSRIYDFAINRNTARNAGLNCVASPIKRTMSALAQTS